MSGFGDVDELAGTRIGCQKKSDWGSPGEETAPSTARRHRNWEWLQRRAHSDRNAKQPGEPGQPCRQIGPEELLIRLATTKGRVPFLHASARYL